MHESIVVLLQFDGSVSEMVQRPLTDPLELHVHLGQHGGSHIFDVIRIIVAPYSIGDSNRSNVKKPPSRHMCNITIHEQFK